MNYQSCPENDDHATACATPIAPHDPRPVSDRPTDLATPSRRQFLAAVGTLTAARMAVGTLGVSVLTGATRTRAGAPPTAITALEARRVRALEIRQQAALSQLAQAFPVPQNNGDERRYPTGVANYSKALPHNALGEVDPHVYQTQTLLQAIYSRTPSAFEVVPLGGTARLANPQGAFAFELEGADPHALIVQAPPCFADEAFAGDMVECYWLALARDIPYAHYGKEPVTAAAINDLKRFSGYEGVRGAFCVSCDLRQICRKHRCGGTL